MINKQVVEMLTELAKERGLEKSVVIETLKESIIAAAKKKMNIDEIHTAWHKNGRKKNEGNYINGKADGMHIIWYQNGQKKKQGFYKRGRADDLLITWNSKGRKNERYFKNGKEIIHA